MTNDRSNIFIIEDDIHIQKDLEVLLSNRDDVNVIGSCTSIKKALSVLPMLNVDLVLMDIELDDGKSFEILEQLPEINFDIIFITAYDEYAIKAIKTGAIDYLLKPVNEDELNEAINRFLKKKNSVLTSGQKDVLLQMISSEEPLKRLVVRTQNGIYFIEIEKLSYCKGEGNYTTFFLNDGNSITSSKPLREYVSILPVSIFIKTHQSYLVNLKDISCYRNSSEIVMKDDSIIPVSARYKEIVLQKLT